MADDNKVMLTGENSGEAHDGILSRIIKPKLAPKPSLKDSAAYNVEVTNRQ